MTLSIRPHQIDFMDDGKSIYPKNGASGEFFFFQRKKRNIDVILGGKNKMLSPDKNEAAK